MAEEVRGRGKLIVAVLVVVLVALAVIFALPMLRGDEPGPQGKLAPDSNEGVNGMGSPETKRSTPELNPGTSGDISNTTATDTGRNAPADPNATPQDAPTDSLTRGRDVDPAPGAPVPR